MEDVLEVIKFLSSPFDDPNLQVSDKLTGAPNPGVFLSSLAQNCLEKLKDIGNASLPPSETSPTWRFTSVILRTLEKLKVQMEEAESSQTEQEKSIEVLSLQNQMQVQKCIELIIGFGVLPYLLPGVGVPNKVRRVNFAAKAFTLEDEKAPDFDKFLRLAEVMQTISELCAHPSLNILFLPKHTCDVIAALLQLCKSPIKKPEPGGGLTLEQYQKVMNTREKLEEFLSQVLVTSPKGILVNSLLLLGSCPKPRWIGKSCYEIVYSIILSEQGLSTISQAILDSMGRANVWKVSRVVSNLVSDAIKFQDPHGICTESRVTNLASQTLQILLTSNQISRESIPSEFNQQLSIVSLVCGLTLLNVNEAVTRTKLWEPLFHPILSLSATSDSLMFSDFIKCTDFASKLISTTTSSDQPLPVAKFQPLWSIFFQLFVTCKVYLTKKVQDPVILDEIEMILPKCENLIVSLFELLESVSGSDDKSSKSSVLNFCTQFITNPENESMKLANRMLFEVRLDQENVCQIVKSDSSSDVNIFEVLSEDCKVLCDLFKSDRLRKMRGKLFSQLMQSSNVESFKKVSSQNSQLLTEFDVQEKVDVDKFIQMQLLGELGKDESIFEELGTVDDPLEMFRFLELILIKLTMELQSSESVGGEYEFNQSIIFCLTIISALCESKKGVSGLVQQGDLCNLKFEWEDLRRFLPYLKQLRESNHAGVITQGIPSMAEDIMILVETKGTGAGKKRNIVEISRYESALKSVGSPLLPEKGHGLLQLRKLVEERDEETMKKEKTVLEIFRREVKNEDSYIYLMAIQGLASLGLKFHSVVVPILTEEYGELSENSASKKATALMKKEERAEFRMKIGETLVKIVQRLGSIAPVYRAQLTNVFFHLIRDEDPLIRASALSNLGELCHLLKFSLGAVLTEVWFCLDSLLKIEKYVEVRRAALHLMVLLLRGVEKDLSTQFLLENQELGQYLRDARRVLTQIHGTEQDTVSTIHCQLALNEIQLIVQKIFTPSDKLEYKIRVLDME